MIEYQRDIPADSPDDVIEATRQHVRDYLATAADADDDPTTRAGDVKVWQARHPEREDLIRIEGYIDAEPNAPYLRLDYDPFAGIDPALMKAAGL